ncbi:MAG: hypothetical protein U0R23_05895 [Candidatus Nanopelagicales bacterium]
MKPLVVAVGLLTLFAGAPPVHAAVEPPVPQQRKVLRAVAKVAPSYAGISVRGSKVTMQLSGIRYRNVRHGVFRSAVDRKYFRVDLVPRPTEAYVAIVEKRPRGYVLRAWDTRWDMIDTLCKQKKPSTAVVYDLGLDPVDRFTAGHRCRQPRDIGTLRTPMSPAEIAGLRAAYEQYLDPETFEMRTVKQPTRFSEVTANCDWEKQGPNGFAPYGGGSLRPTRGSSCFASALHHRLGGRGGRLQRHRSARLADRPVGEFTELLAHVRPGYSPAPAPPPGGRSARLRAGVAA